MKTVILTLAVNHTSKVILFFLVAFSFSSCKFFHAENYDKLSQDLGAFKDEVTNILSDPNRAMGELRKLREFEYKVFDVSENETPEDTEKTLNTMGKDYWDCYHIERQAIMVTKNIEGGNDETKRQFILRFFCKKQAFTPLRFITH